LLRGVVESLTAAPSGTVAVLGVDDAHLLDELSMFVLHQIVQRGAANVLLTVRDDDPLPVAVQEVWAAGQFDARRHRAPPIWDSRLPQPPKDRAFTSARLSYAPRSVEPVGP
jgi:hypothetical protein